MFMLMSRMVGAAALFQVTAEAPKNVVYVPTLKHLKLFHFYFLRTCRLVGLCT